MEKLTNKIDIDQYLYELKEGYLRPKIEEIHIDDLGDGRTHTKRITIWLYEEKVKV